MAGYKIKSGDTLSQIAKRNGMSLKALLAANPSIKNANKIRVGQSLKIPSTSMLPGSKTNNPYKGISRSQMADMDVKNKSEKRQRTATRSMQTQVKEGGAQNTPTKKKTEATMKKASHLESPSQLRERARKYAAKKKTTKRNAPKSMNSPSLNEGYYSVGGRVFTGR